MEALVNLTQQGRSYLNSKLASLAVVLFLLLLPGTSDCADAFRAPYVYKIRIEGNEAFSDGKLKKVMKTKERSILRPFRKSAFRKDFLGADIESILGLYRRHGYLKAKLASETVDRVRGGRAVIVSLEFSEGSLVIVNAVSIEGPTAIPQKELTRELRLKVGSPFDPGAVEEDKQSILERYAGAGYVYASVSDNTVFEENLADVHYHVRESIQARTGEIYVRGNKTVAERLVGREVTLKRGDVLKRPQLIRTQQRIYDTGLFSDVEISPMDGDSVRPVVDLKVLVKERKMGWVGTGVGYGSSDQLRVFGEWGHRNVLGGAQRLFASVNFAFGRWWLNDGTAALDASRFDVGIVEPWLFGTRTAGQLVLYHEYKKEAAFTQEFDGVTFTGTRDLSASSKALLSYDNRWVNTTDPSALRSKYVTRSLYLSGVRDKRDDIFDPDKGFYQEATWKVAGGVLGGNFNFQKISASSSWYSPVGKVVLATRLKVGFVEPFGETQGGTSLEKIPFEERFRTGGATSVRGYFEDEEIGPRDASGTAVGGRFLVVSNVEIRFPLFWKLSAALFVDGGNVWEDPSDVKLRQFDLAARTLGDTDYRYSFGGGIRLSTPVGPVRMDYGRKLRLSVEDGDDRGQFHFSLGQAF